MPVSKPKKVTPKASKPKPSDLGKGAAKNAAEAIVKRKKMLDSI